MDKEKQLCPLKNGKMIRDCDEEKCAWWINKMRGKEIDSCSILAIAVSILHFAGRSNRSSYKK